ncbi:MAG TPA: hypothetical protein VMR33_14825 [Candidatus Baltobacteraceae bacterium]|jgi:hypothetical protein|nr:hypothetical protein [Candidatus Baltobacteraceae bacterium]
MEQPGMRRFGLILVCALVIAAGAAAAATYKLADGSEITGDPISVTETGVVFEKPDGTDSERLSWDKLTPEALKELYAQDKSPHDRALLQPLVENLPEDTVKVKELAVKPVETPARPTQHLGVFAIFGSSVGWMIVLILYGATIYAAYEVALFRRQPVSTVCGLAAVPFFGVLSPIVFIAMPTKAPPPQMEETAPAAPAEEGAPAPEPAAYASRAAASPNRAPIGMPGAAAAAEAEAVPPASAFPEPVVFARGEYTFNRRFFETKFPGFFRAIRTEAEKDLVLLLKTSRGDFVGRRITRITPNELYLQVFNKDVTADEMIPFIEVMEVQIRHKDAP